MITHVHIHRLLAAERPVELTAQAEHVRLLRSLPTRRHGGPRAAALGRHLVPILQLRSATDGCR